jgi:hypothetical protein
LYVTGRVAYADTTTNPLTDFRIDSSQRTDEGYNAESVSYSVDLNRRTIVRETYTEGRDCDGKHHYSYTEELGWDDVPNYHPDHGDSFWHPESNCLIDAKPARGWKRKMKNS